MSVCLGRIREVRGCVWGLESERGRVVNPGSVHRGLWAWGWESASVSAVESQSQNHDSRNRERGREEECEVFTFKICVNRYKADLLPFLMTLTVSYPSCLH